MLVCFIFLTFTLDISRCLHLKYKSKLMKQKAPSVIKLRKSYLKHSCGLFSSFIFFLRSEEHQSAADPGGGMCAPSWSKFVHFLAVFGKNVQKYRLACLPWELVSSLFIIESKRALGMHAPSIQILSFSCNFWQIMFSLQNQGCG